MNKLKLEDYCLTIEQSKELQHVIWDNLHIELNTGKL